MNVLYFVNGISVKEDLIKYEVAVIQLVISMESI